MEVKYLINPIVILLFFMAFLNTRSFLNNVNSEESQRFSYQARLNVAKKIIQSTERKEYNLVGAGEESRFSSFTMNYEYLTWWIGHGPKTNPQSLKVIISESSKGITFEKK